MSTLERPDQLYGLLARAGEPRGFSAGDVIFEQGDPVLHVGFLETGGRLTVPAVSGSDWFSHAEALEAAGLRE
jgi:hypothetical protein